MKIQFTSFLFLLLLFVVACGNPEKTTVDIIRDSVNVLTTRQQEDLEKEIKALEDSVGSQIRILIVNSLNGEKIEEYSLRVTEAWAIGRVGFNDGILITIAIRDKQMRIEVGTGLENIIKDDIAAEIIREDMTPQFREAKYYEGLSTAVQRIKTLIKTNSQRIGEKPEIATEENVANETPTIDDYLVESISDTAIQKISGSLVLIIHPGQEQIDAMLKEYGEEDLSTILDDASFYQSSAINLIDSLGIKTVTAEKRFIYYQNVIREWNLDLHKNNSPWVVIFFDLDQRPEVVSTIEVTEEKIKAYFNP